MVESHLANLLTLVITEELQSVLQYLYLITSYILYGKMIPWEITKYITNQWMGTIWPALHHEIRLILMENTGESTLGCSIYQRNNSN